MPEQWLWPLVGGLLIGCSASIMLIANGRVTGVSGIVGNVLTQAIGPRNWRLLFVLGLLCGGFLLKFFMPETLETVQQVDDVHVVIAGLLVGFGTIMGSGCTSGHGVCGLSRLSPRSAVATVIFILMGMITVLLLGNK